jgi:hypothetical protein
VDGQPISRGRFIKPQRGVLPHCYACQVLLLLTEPQPTETSESTCWETKSRNSACPHEQARRHAKRSGTAMLDTTAQFAAAEVCARSRKPATSAQFRESRAIGWAHQATAPPSRSRRCQSDRRPGEQVRSAVHRVQIRVNAHVHSTDRPALLAQRSPARAEPSPIAVAWSNTSFRAPQTTGGVQPDRKRHAGLKDKEWRPPGKSSPKNCAVGTFGPC